MTRIKLKSIELTNYLGAGDPGVLLDFGGQHAVICGPNNTGKTTILSALFRVGQFAQVQFVRSFGGAPSGEPFQWPVTLSDWADARLIVTAQLFHGHTQTFQITPRLLFGPAIPEAKEVFPFWEEPEPIVFEFVIAARKDQKVQIQRLRDGDLTIFDMGGSTHLFREVTNDMDRQANITSFLANHREAHKIFGLPGRLLRRVIYFPSHRRPTLGFDSQINSLAGGSGLVTWVESASNPDPRDAHSAGRNYVLEEFQREFADFAGFRNVALSVRRYTLPLQNDDQPEINVTIDGNVRLLSQLGAGIGEALIILLVCKLSRAWDPPIDVVLLEEPELHLHPRLQRKLLHRVLEYGVQLIVTTHSPTVLDALARQGARVFRTSFDQARKAIHVEQIAGLTESRTLLDSIGSTPADLLLADKVPWVEGPSDVPVFRTWIAKAPGSPGQNIAILPLGGHDAASENFDPSHLAKLHPRMLAILDSERRNDSERAAASKLKIEEKLLNSGIACHLTERRATENYFTSLALEEISPGLGALGPFEAPDSLARRGQQFSKSKNGLVAEAMSWDEIQGTDIGRKVAEFLSW